jgi:hypothetical protein
VASWPAFVRNVTAPVPLDRHGARPYLLAVALFACANVLLALADTTLLRYGLPWTLVSLLVVVASANLWGVRPALLVLALSALYWILYPLPAAQPRVLSLDLLVMRAAVFVACGAATIWLTFHARHMQRTAERGREVIAALQSMILPESLPEVPGCELSGVYRPAHREEDVGGDFYDFYPIGPGMYGILIGDVMGKGKEAATSTALLRYSVRAFTSIGARPGQIVSQVNNLIDAQGMDFGTATLFFGCLDTNSGSLCYANAGHEPPMLRRADGSEEVLDSTGPILGACSGIAYEERSVVMAQRDALLLMTDGVTEARDGTGRFLNPEGAWKLLHASATAPSAQAALAALDTELMTYIGANSRDDIAMLLLRRTVEAQGPPQDGHVRGMATRPPPSDSTGREIAARA